VGLKERFSGWLDDALARGIDVWEPLTWVRLLGRAKALASMNADARKLGWVPELPQIADAVDALLAAIDRQRMTFTRS